MKRARLGQNVLFVIGIIYTILGGIFVVVGVPLWIALAQEDARIMGVIFSGMGGLFLALGVVLLLIELRKQRRKNCLLASGRYIWGEVIDCAPNFNVHINHRHPYVAIVRYTDIRGMAHIFKSENLLIFKDPALIGRKVKVYIEDDTYKYYYVDMDGVLPQYIEH